MGNDLTNQKSAMVGLVDIGLELAEQLHAAKITVADLREREAKLREALKTAEALTTKYISRISFEGLGDREITELREVHYQAHEALRSEYTAL